MTTNTSHHFKNVTITTTEWRSFLFSLLWDVWRASHRMFTKHFNPSNPSINQLCKIIYVGRFLSQLLQDLSDFLQHV